MKNNKSLLLLKISIIGITLLLAFKPLPGTDETLKEIKIGKQVWSAMNLDIAHFRNGDIIPEIQSNEAWVKAGKEQKPVWCYYKNDQNTRKTYGKLYNWYALNDPRGLAPEGWHIPTNEEWIELENYLGTDIVGMRLKCDKGWNDNGNGDNSSGFCLYAGGYRDRNGNFTGSGEFTYLSGISEGKLDDATDDKKFIWGRGINFEHKGIMRCGLDKEFGLYVRCVKDN